METHSTPSIRPELPQRVTESDQPQRGDSCPAGEKERYAGTSESTAHTFYEMSSEWLREAVGICQLIIFWMEVLVVFRKNLLSSHNTHYVDNF